MQRIALLVAACASLYAPLWGMTDVLLSPLSAPQNIIALPPCPNEPNPGTVLDINEDEPLTCESFSTLIKAAHAARKHYILARVTSQDDPVNTDDTNKEAIAPKIYRHNYDAVALNVIIRKHHLDAFKVPTEFKNPNNNLPIRDIDFFRISHTPDMTCTHLGSYEAIRKNSWWPHIAWNKIFPRPKKSKWKAACCLCTAPIVIPCTAICDMLSCPDDCSRHYGYAWRHEYEDEDESEVQPPHCCCNLTRNAIRDYSIRIHQIME